MLQNMSCRKSLNKSSLASFTPLDNNRISSGTRADEGRFANLWVELTVQHKKSIAPNSPPPYHGLALSASRPHSGDSPMRVAAQSVQGLNGQAKLPPKAPREPGQVSLPMKFGALPEALRSRMLRDLEPKVLQVLCRPIKKHDSQTELFRVSGWLHRAEFDEHERELILAAWASDYYRPISDREIERAASRVVSYRSAVAAPKWPPVSGSVSVE